MNPFRVVLTGPIGSLPDWENAGRAAGVQIHAAPVLQVRAQAFELDDGKIDWLLITSAQALPSLEPHRKRLAKVPAAVVGKRGAQRLTELGLRVEVGPFASGLELFEAWREELSPGVAVLWPGGPLRGSIGTRLTELGARLSTPLAYTNEPVPGARLPEADAILFAAPSGVTAARERGWPGAPVGLAIGSSTAQALHESPAGLSRIEQLDEPTAEAFARWCRGQAAGGR